MRKIKFRARELGGGFLYAELGQIYSIPHREKYLEFIVDGCSYTVIADSLAIRVGYDKDGKEVYEGDVLIGSDGNEYTAYLWAVADGEIDFKLLGNEYENISYTLKECA